MPSKLTSYATAGRPLLAAVPAGGNHRLLPFADRGIAEVVAPGDAGALVAGIEALRADPAKCDAMVRKATELATSLQPAEAMLPGTRSFIR